MTYKINIIIKKRLLCYIAEMTHRGNCFLKTCHNEETTKLYNIKLREYVMRYWFSEEDGKRYIYMHA